MAASFTHPSSFQGPSRPRSAPGGTRAGRTLGTSSRPAQRLAGPTRRCPSAALLPSCAVCALVSCGSLWDTQQKPWRPPEVAHGAASSATLPRRLGGGCSGEKQGQPPARGPPWHSLSPWAAGFHSQPKPENNTAMGGFSVCHLRAPKRRGLVDWRLLRDKRRILCLVLHGHGDSRCSANTLPLRKLQRLINLRPLIFTDTPGRLRSWS